MIKTDVCCSNLSISNGPEDGAVRGREIGGKRVHFTCMYHFLTR